MGKSKGLVPIIFTYLAIAVLFTWPLAAQITTHGFGVDEDSPYHIWHNWWLKFSLFDLRQSPLWTDYVFHPQKIPLIYDANSFVFGALTLPLQFLTSTLVASNVVFLLSFALASLAMFFLVKHLTGSSPVALFSGFVFAFSPYTLAQALDGHTNLTTTWIIPLYTLFLLKALDHPDGDDGKFSILNSQFSIFAGFLAALQLYSDFTYTAFLVIETGLILAFFLLQLIFKKDRSEPARPPFVTMIRIMVTGGLILLTAALLGSPLLLEIVRVSKAGFRVGSPLWAQNEWSADLKAFLFPNDRSTIFRPVAYTPPRGTVEGTVFLGYAVSLLFLLALIFYSRRKNPLPAASSKLARPTLWAFLALSFFFLSLGPTLHFNGQFQFNFLGFRDVVFPLPWAILHKIPFIGETQEPTRINPFLSLSVTVTLAYFLKDLLSIIRSEKMKAIFISGVFLITLAEYLPLPFPTTDLRPPEIFKLIAQDRGNFSVLVLPVGFNSGNLALGPSPIGSLQYFQVIHQHPSFRATVARLPAWAFAYYQNIPYFPFFLNQSIKPGDENLPPDEIKKIYRETLGVKYIVVSEKHLKGNFGQMADVLENKIGAQPFYNRDGMKGYLLP